MRTGGKCRACTPNFAEPRSPREVRALVAFDRLAFTTDWYTPAMWREFESYWLYVGRRKVGCCAFNPHTDFTDDLTHLGEDPPLRGSLHIVSTAVAPKYRGQGWGSVIKAWQIAYAKRNGFTRLITACRKSNAAMIGLNKKFSFEVVRTTPRYYRDPLESVVVLELRLSGG